MTQVQCRRSVAAVDECPHGNERDCDDLCGEDCETHHLNVNRIADDLYARYWRRNAVVVMWSDSPQYTFCSEAKIGNVYFHKPENVYALAAQYEDDTGALVNQPIVQMVTITNNDVERECSDIQLMSFVLAHEIAHTLGLEEMYNNDNYYNHDEGTGLQCIMESIAEDEVQYVDNLYLNIIGNGAPSFYTTCLEKLRSLIVNAYES